jgi:cyclopropane fatty-acyl-phospholipid synthase-like methyltransferase
MLPFSQACENNKAPILQILKSAFSPCRHVLEIGSGTGQHAVYFAANLEHLLWQPSDRLENHEGIQLWLNEYSGENMLALETLDVEQASWPTGFDAVFSANTAHIMSWEQAQLMLRRVAQALPENGVFALYGPFKYEGRFTSESNARFDASLKAQVAHRGIRDFEDVNSILCENGMTLIRDHRMPAKNQLIVWKKI